MGFLLCTRRCVCVGVGEGENGWKQEGGKRGRKKGEGKREEGRQSVMVTKSYEIV